MKLKLLSAAQADVASAISYYNDQKLGLGSEFAGEVRKTIERILQFPEAWTRMSGRIRRCQVNRFPYSVFYSFHKDFVIVTAVLHNRRSPRTWQTRDKD